MLSIFRAVAVVSFSAALYGQGQPQLVWQGEVDATAVIYVRGKRLQVQDRGGGLPVQRQRYEFYDKLPDNRQDVNVRVAEGRGQVRVIEQPRLENNYTLSVGVDDRQGGSAFYALEFYWNPGDFLSGNDPFDRRKPSRSNFSGERVTWSGRVDDEVLIACRENTCEPSIRSGQPVVRDRYQFSRPMPEEDFRVSLVEKEGRGDVRLAQQPSAANGYSAVVQIRDTEGGSSDYSFTLGWERTGRQERGRLFTERGLLWSGRVDGQVRVIVQGREARADVLTGAPVSGDRVQFDRELPSRPTSNVTVRRRRGRGRVGLVEYPSSRNGYRIVFQIDDFDGGADQYEVEVGW